MSDSTNVSNGTRTITIKGVPLSYVERYRANNGQIERRNGDTWSVVTDELPMLVSRITQDMSQNLGNNFRGRVQGELEAHKVADGAALPAEVIAVLQAEFAEEVAEYEFGSAGGPRGPRDPIKNLTMNYLENMIRATAAAKGIANFSKTDVMTRATALYEKNPAKYRAQAEAAAKAAAKKQDDDLDAVMAA